jgi:hypothetical protein
LHSTGVLLFIWNCPPVSAVLLHRAASSWLRTLEEVASPSLFPVLVVKGEVPFLNGEALEKNMNPIKPLCDSQTEVKRKMKKQSLLVSLLVISCVAFLFGAVYATQPVPDTVTMNSTVHGEHTKPLVTLTHKKHNVDYQVPCAECHHVVENGKNVWKEGDAVQKCEACHSQAKAPKANPGDAQPSKAEKIKLFHYSAIHENCVGCHKEFKKAGKSTGPTSCKQCHT